jgi:hypothetical protein
MGEKSATQRATKVAAGGFWVNALGELAKELINQEFSVSNAVFCGSSFMGLSLWLNTHRLINPVTSPTHNVVRSQPKII